MTYNIVHVVRDFFTGKLKFVSKEVAQQRFDVCLQCDARDEALNICTICSCYLPAKTKLKDATCPMELW